MAPTQTGSFRHRLTGLVVAAPAASMLVIGAALPPSDTGHGTHQSMGLPPCGWVIAFDKPCMTCGMTTAVSRAVHADVFGSFSAQPFGTILALVAAMIVWAGLQTAILGCDPLSMVRPMFGRRLLFVVGALFLMAWVYKLLTW